MWPARTERACRARESRGASTIIAIDPIRARREVAMKVGATHTLDPNVEGDKLVESVRELSKGPNNRCGRAGATRAACSAAPAPTS